MLAVSLKQEDYEFKTNLGHIMRPCLKKKKNIKGRQIGSVGKGADHATLVM